MGTPAFMSPEQWLGDSEAGPTADIYSFGCMLYQMCTGHIPFMARNVRELYRKHLEEAPVMPSAVNPRLPKVLDRIVSRCMEKNGAQRYGDFTELRSELLEVYPRITGKNPPVELTRFGSNRKISRSDQLDKGLSLYELEQKKESRKLMRDALNNRTEPLLTQGAREWARRESDQRTGRRLVKGGLKAGIRADAKTPPKPAPQPEPKPAAKPKPAAQPKPMVTKTGITGNLARTQLPGSKTVNSRDSLYPDDTMGTTATFRGKTGTVADKTGFDDRTMPSTPDHTMGVDEAVSDATIARPGAPAAKKKSLRSMLLGSRGDKDKK